MFLLRFPVYDWSYYFNTIRRNSFLIDFNVSYWNGHVFNCSRTMFETIIVKVCLIYSKFLIFFFLDFFDFSNDLFTSDFNFCVILIALIVTLSLAEAKAIVR